MALWEYKIIGSGKGGFGSPSLLESHLNQLGKDEWEIIAFTSHPDNPLAFHGLARRTTQRDWTLQDAAAAAAKAEAEKLRAEFAAKFQAAQSSSAPAAEDKPTTLVAETAAPEDGLRSLRDTDRDQDPEALADADDDEWKQLESEDELPTFFEFIRPHMRRNQRGPGMSLAVDYLANKIDQSPADVVTALRECGFEIPEREDDDPVYLEYDGDLYWINTNRHHQLFINTKEKPRPVFRATKGQPFAAPEKTDDRASRNEGRQRRPEPAAPESTATAGIPDAPAEVSAPAPAPGADTASPAVPAAVAGTPAASSGGPELPSGAEALMARLRPMMRRNRRGPGVSGSVSFLSRALKLSDQELAATLAAAGLPVPAHPNDKPVYTDVGIWTYWLNKDSRGGLWINGRERRERDGRDRPDRGSASAESGSREEPVASPDAQIPAETSVTPDSQTPPENPPAAPVVAPPLVVPAEDAESVVRAQAVTLADRHAPVHEPEPAPAEAAKVTDSTVVIPPTPEGSFSLGAVRLLLKPKPRGTGSSAELGVLARALNTPEDLLLEQLRGAGLVLPVEGEDKSPTVELEGDVLWLQKSEKGGSVWLNAKAKPVRRPRAAAGGGRRPSRKAPEPSVDIAEGGEV